MTTAQKDLIRDKFEAKFPVPIFVQYNKKADKYVQEIRCLAAFKNTEYYNIRYDTYKAALAELVVPED